MPDTNVSNPVLAQSAWRLPFLKTAPLTDVLLMITLLPLWWALGLDQLIWPVGGAWAAVKLLRRRQWRVDVPLPLRLYGLFVGLQLVSVLFIVEPERYLTFARTLGAYVGAGLFALVIVNEVRTARQVRLAVAVMVGVLGLTALLGALSLVGVFRPSYVAPTALLIPDALERTSYGRAITLREFGNPDVFLVNFYRPHAFFLFANVYALALLMAIPLTLLAFRGARQTAVRVALGGALLLLLLNLLGTTSRMALACLFIGGVYVAVTTSRRRVRNLFLLAVVLIALLGGFIVGLGTGILPQSLARPVIASVFGRQSFYARGFITLGTLAQASERPLLGWGAERDMASWFPYPAGSHSTYLGVIHRFGAVGFGLFVALWVAVWRGTRPPARRNETDNAAVYLNQFLWTGRWALVALLINALTEVLDLDTTLFVLLWTLVALLLAARALLNAERATEPAT